MQSGRKPLECIEPQGYLIGDKAYDSSTLYDTAARKDLKLVAPQARPGKLGHRKHSPHRVAMLDRLSSKFIKTLFSTHVGIEHFFGQWTSFYCGLKPLPSWVRGLFRVENRIRAKLVIYYNWRQMHVQN
jgi:hypothetical protein